MKILQLNTIRSYHDFIGIATHNELISVVDFTNDVGEIPHAMKNFGFYSIFLKGADCGDLQYGRQKYDYQSGTLVFSAPGQIIGNPNGGSFNPQGNALFFHPDLLLGTDLKNIIEKYSYFSYQTNESLHISDEERAEVLAYFKKINEGISTKKSNAELVAIIIEFLDKCLQFYDRQFTSRTEINKDILSRFEVVLEDFYKNKSSEKMPTVSFFADKLFLSANYFGDLIKKETGKAPKAYIQQKIIELAKNLLISTNENINEIAYQLGFEYPHYFGRMFKKNVGKSPKEFRSQEARHAF